MNKKDFFKEIKKGLKDFNYEEAQKIIEYYEELISDYIDEGMSEEEAVQRLGDVEKIINDLKTDLVIERSSNKNTNSFKNFLIVLSITTSPVLIPLGIVFFVVFFSLLITLLSLLVSFGFTSILMFFSSIYTSIEMIIHGVDAATIITLLGVQLFVGALFGLLTIGIYEVSKVVLNFINKYFSKLLRKRNNKEGKMNG